MAYSLFFDALINQFFQKKPSRRLYFMYFSQQLSSPFELLKCNFGGKVTNTAHWPKTQKKYQFLEGQCGVCPKG